MRKPGNGSPSLAAAALAAWTLGSAFNFAQDDSQKVQLVLGEYKKIHSTILGEERTIIVHLPDGYGDVSVGYPVLYTYDAESVSRFRRVCLAVDLLADREEAPAMIVVGILNTNRLRDLTHTKMVGRDETGGWPRFLRFMTEELFPFVDGSYRTLPFRLVYGESAAGRHALLPLLTDPSLFDVHLAAAPAMASQPGYEYDDEIVYRLALKRLEDPDSLNRKFLYMDMGTNDMPARVAKFQELVELLRGSAPPGLRWKGVLMEGEGHVTGECVLDGLRFAFEGWELPASVIVDQGMDGIRAHARRMAERYGVEFPLQHILSPRKVAALGYAYSAAENWQETIRMFEIMAAGFPDQGWAWESLARAHEWSGNVAKAIENYKRALELDPESSSASEALARLQKGGSD